jgi:uncharacterized protein YndB with AHSA1/START domain
MNAPARITPAPVRKTLRVKVPQAKAFEVFTARIDAWWPKSHHMGKAPLKTVTIEPFMGGRWVHLSEDGSEDVTGIVRLWQPPERVVMTWRLNSKFVLDDTIDSEVDIRFIPDGADATRVELEHRVTAVDGREIAAAVGSDGGWPALMALFAAWAESHR